jgi:Cdc6-like AAA superfamily ATPase
MTSIPNPFHTKAAIATAKDIWRAEISDFAPFHAAASQTILSALEQTRGTFSIAVTGAVGSGKTHLFSRLRHHLSERDAGLSVYFPADQIPTNEESIITVPLYVVFLQSVVASLCRPAPSGGTYLQEIATNLVNQALTGIKSPQRFTVTKLLERFHVLATNNNLTEKITRQIQQDKPYLLDSTDVIRALLWTLSDAKQNPQTILEENPASTDYYLAPRAVAWLKGKEILDEEAQIMKVVQEQYADAMAGAKAQERAMQILRITAEYRPVLICFDELDAIKWSANGDPLRKIIADFIRSLHNGLEQVDFPNPFCLLSLWLPKTYDSVISASEGTTDRVCSLPSLNREPISLDRDALNADTGLQLVDFWLEQANAKDPVDPYRYLGGAENIRRFCSTLPNPRQLWRWCAENWNHERVPDHVTIQKVYDTLIDKGCPSSLMDDASQIVKALRFGLGTILNQTIENVTIQQPPVDMPAAARFQLTIHGTENGKPVAIGVGVNQANANSARSMLEQLTDYKKHKLTRGCLVRSEDKKINKGTQADKLLEKLTDLDGLKGELVPLKEQQILELYALQELQDQPEIQGLDSATVAQFITEKASYNGLIKEILSDPSGVIPQAMFSIPSLFPNPSTPTQPSNELSESDFI